MIINTGEGLRGIRVSEESGRFSASETWQSRVTICQTSNFLIYNGVIYGAKEGRVFAAVDATNGKTVWQNRALQDFTLIRTGELLVAVQEDGQVAVAQPRPSGVEVVWQQPVLEGRCWAGPIFCNGWLILRDNQSLVAFQIPE